MIPNTNHTTHPMCPLQQVIHEFVFSTRKLVFQQAIDTDLDLDKSLYPDLSIRDLYSVRRILGKTRRFDAIVGGNCYVCHKLDAILNEVKPGRPEDLSCDGMDRIAITEHALAIAGFKHTCYLFHYPRLLNDPDDPIRVD